ncbi:MAG: hypothetical protein ACKO54_06040, partial [Alphaproteobacteria bacterium]
QIPSHGQFLHFMWQTPVFLCADARSDPPSPSRFAFAWRMKAIRYQSLPMNEHSVKKILWLCLSLPWALTDMMA